MSAPSEPEKYSIDDMMDRLKSRPAEDPIENGELVTRADGSQAIRVRKKKRRSQQPHKEERKNQRRSRMIQVSGGLILLLLALFCAGFAIAFANSATFREGLVKKCTLSSGAAVEMQQFRMNPTSANANTLTLTWPGGNVLDNLTLRGIKAEISPVSFLGKSMTGETAGAGEGTLTLRVPQPDQASRAVPATEGILPIRFNHYAIQKFHLVIGDPAAPKIHMRNSEATFIPLNPTERPQLLLTRGEITIAGCPKLRMDRSHIEFRDNEADIIVMRLKHETDNKGTFELSGTVSPYATDRASTLAVQLDSFLVSGIAGPQIGRLFSGHINTLPSATSNYLSFTPGPDPASSLSLNFGNALSSPFEVNGFPFLFGLSQTLDDEWFSRPVFDHEIRGILRRADGNVSIGDLNLESRGRMALRGAVAMTSDQRLSGELEIGIAEGMIKTSGDRRLNGMFSPPKDGFRWLSLKISGSAATPADNFKDLYDSAAVLVSPAPASEIPSFEELTRPK